MTDANANANRRQNLSILNALILVLGVLNFSLMSILRVCCIIRTYTVDATIN